jgi:signal transduction histidine kinase/CheY-like chemotaxis protein
MPAPAPRAWRTPQYISAITASYALIGGLVSLLGWLTGIYPLTDWWNTGIAIKANTAVTAIATGTALLGVVYSFNFASRISITAQISRGLGLFILTIGALTLSEHITGFNFGIDTLLVDEPAGAIATSAPGRMGPPAAFSFFALGTAIFLRASSPSRKHMLSISLAIAVVGIGTLSLVGYWYGAEAMYTIPRLTGISVQTATMLVALAIGIIATYDEYEPTKTLSEKSNIGILARRVMAAAFIVPIGLGWIRIHGFRAGLYDNPFGTALRSITEIVILVGVLWWSVQAIRIRELRQRRAETDKQSSEQQLVHELREADRRKDEFLATLAHELRNPLAPIRNAAAVLIEKNISLETLQTSAKIIDRQVSHMARLLEDLLDISRISRNRLQLRREPIELNQIIQSAVETSRPTIEYAHHELFIEYPSESIIVDADAVRLAQVFSNLLNNAAQYTKNGGRITIATESDADFVSIHIIDNGMGIDSQALHQVFDMFTQVSPASLTSKSGLGIGLALAREIVELHGGTIKVASAGTNRGSTFSVHLPRLQKNTEVTAITATAPPVVKRRLLVVDDVKDNADTLAILLKYMGHEVQVAYGGHAALIAAETYLPDALLMDIGMPELDGLQVCKKIRLTPWGKNIFIVALTGWGHAEDLRRTEEAGFNAHLIKPVNPTELLALLATI